MKSLNKSIFYVMSLFLAMMLFGFSSVQAQTPPYHNISTKLLDSDNAANVESTTFDNGYVTTGSTFDGLRELVNLVKYDANGNILWDWVYVLDINETRGNDVEVTNFNEYIIAGRIENSLGGTSAPAVFYTDPAGNLLWTQRYDLGTGFGEAHSIEEIPGGTPLGERYVVTGTVRGFGGGTLDLFVITIDGAGNLVQQAIFDTGTDEEGLSVQVIHPFGAVVPSYAVAGYTGSSPFLPTTDAWVMMLDFNLNMAWSQVYGGTKDDVANSLAITPAGDIAAAGFSNSFSNGNNDMFITLFDNVGTKLWSNIYGFKGDDYLYSIQTLSDFTFAASGSTDKVSANTDAALIKVDFAGNLMWSRSWGGNGVDVAYSVKESNMFPGSDLFLAGVFEENPSTTAAGEQIYHIRTNFTGDSACAKKPGLLTKVIAPVCNPVLIPHYAGLVNGMSPFAADMPFPNSTNRCCDCASMFVDFYISPATFCVGNIVDFINTSTCIDQFRWAVDGTFIPGSPSTTHVFTTMGAHTITLYGRNLGCPIVSKTITVNVTCRVAGEGEFADEMSLSPNPTSGPIVVETLLENTADETAQLQVFDITGKVVYSESVNVNQGMLRTQIDLTEQPAGMYLIEVQAAGARHTEHLIISE